METRSARRRRLSNSEHQINGVDYISNLPDALLHHILCLLPINTVAQTATLSSRWRSIWYTLPDLDFSTNSNSIFHSNPADIITRILNSRDNKHNNVRLLRFSANLSFSHLNGLFRTAIRHNIQELDVQVTTNDYFNFPRCVIASDTLRVFNLRSVNPGFRLPPPSVMASGFRSLNSLSLVHIVFSDRPSLLDLFTRSSFPLLKKLSLQSCFGLKHLRVHCPVLKYFSLHWCFQLQGLDVFGAKLETIRICSCFDAFSNPTWVRIAAPNLKTLYWFYNAITDQVNFHDLKSLNQASVALLPPNFRNINLQSLSALLSGISHAHSLTLESLFIDILCSNNYFSCYFPPFNNVKSLELQTGLRKQNGTGLANMFRSCPVLHTLTIKIDDDSTIGKKDMRKDKLERVVSEDEEQFWETQSEPLKSFLLHLKVVRIEGFKECLNEVRLTQFLLKHGTALQELTIFTSKTNQRDSIRRREIKSQIMAVSRASSDVKIQYS